MIPPRFGHFLSSNMIGLTVILVAFSFSLVESATEIRLPKDVDFVTVIGTNFKLEINQGSNVQRDWGNIVNEIAHVEKEKIKNPSKDVVLGPMSNELLEWVQEQATALDNKIFRFIETIESMGPSNQRVVAQVLLLNSLVELDQLRQENLKQLKWIRKKAKSYKRVEEEHMTEVEKWVYMKMHDSTQIEESLRGTKNPGNKWLTNVKALKRILLEQHFSSLIDEMITDFLKQKLWDIERSNVFDVFSSKSKIDDGLYYEGSKGLVPSHFPFSAQEAIVNEA